MTEIKTWEALCSKGVPMNDAMLAEIIELRAALAQQDALYDALAKIRDSFLIPAKGSPLESSWGAAMSDATQVPDYVAAQLKQGKPVARVTGYFAGRCVVEPLNRALVLPTDMALYTYPQLSQQGEPVAWFIDVTTGGKSTGDYQVVAREHWGDLSKCIPLYTSPPARQLMTQEEAENLAHRRASVYAHRSDPTHCAYTFLPHTLMDFVRAIEAHHGITGEK